MIHRLAILMGFLRAIIKYMYICNMCVCKYICIYVYIKANKTSIMSRFDTIRV